MDCYHCKYYHQGYTDNKCELTESENFYTLNKCNMIDDNYNFLEDDEYYGWKKKTSADKLIENRKLI
jgi:hypothetical protein